MRWLLILLPTVAMAGGPKYTYPKMRGLDDEMHNIYHDLSNPVINYATISSATWTLGQNGAGSASLGANCPASVTSAPYMWIVMISSDGTKVYVPAWK